MTQGKMTMKTKTTKMKKWRQETKATRMTTKMTTQESRADEHEHAQKTKRRRTDQPPKDAV